jgi:hypothetical protein
VNSLKTLNSNCFIFVKNEILIMKKIFFPALLLIFAAVMILSCKKNSSDSNQPFIILLGQNPLNWGLDVPYADPGAEAYVVSQSGDTTNISTRLEMTDNVNVSQEGTYQVNYNVTDADGMAADQKTRTVNVVLGK